MLKRSLLCGVFVALPAFVVADQLTLSNGDSLQGEIITLKKDTLVFKSPLLGELEVPMSSVSSFSTNQPIELHLQDGQVINPQVGIAPSGFIQPVGEETPVALQQIAGINPEPEKPVQWKSNVFAGADIERGNTEEEDYELDIKITRETKKDRVIASLYYEWDREESDSGDLETSTRHVKLGGHYDYFISPKRYVYADGRAERETTDELDLRLVFGLGAGYRWLETSTTRLEFEAGPSWVSEEFTDGSPDEKYVALRTATRLTHELTSDFSLFSNIEWLGSVESSDDQLFSMDSGLSYKVNHHISLDARWYYDWDKSPVEGEEKGDLRYVFGASLGF